MDKRASQQGSIPEVEEGEEEDEQNFDPQSPRANFSLFPLEHLLYCAECKEIRCPKCVVEDVLAWFCPSCQLEAGSSAVRGDGNRLVLFMDLVHEYTDLAIDVREIA